MRGNVPFAAPIPGVVAAPVFLSPGERSSALAEPAERGLLSRRSGRRLVLAVTPGAARALLVLPLPARDADHPTIVPQHEPPGLPRARGARRRGLEWCGLGGVGAAHPA